MIFLESCIHPFCRRIKSRGITLRGGVSPGDERDEQTLCISPRLAGSGSRDPVETAELQVLNLSGLGGIEGPVLAGLARFGFLYGLGWLG